VAGVHARRDAEGTQAAVIGLLAVGLAIGRDSLTRIWPAFWVPSEAAGYLALCLLVLVTIGRSGLRMSDLGLGKVDVRTRIFGCVVLSAVFVAPDVGRSLRWERQDALWEVLIAAPTEELLCRGVLFALIARRWNTTIAVGASSLVFSAMHAAAHAPLALLAALAAGLVLGIWRAMSRDLVAPTIGHVVADIVAGVVM